MQQQFNPKNKDLQVWVGDRLYHRDEAKVSVFDSVVQGGDAVWEGLRLYDGKIFCLDRHLERMQLSAKALAFANVPSNEEITEAIRQTLRANQMDNKVHIRLTLTRGTKITSGMDPRLNQYGCTLIVLAEWKDLVYPPAVKMITSSIRRNSPMFLDSKIHHNNLLNNILAKLEANYAGVDEALMLDLNGYVSEANSVNVFLTRKGTVYTPHADSCLPGITRGLVLEICRAKGIPAVEKNLSVVDFYSADEVFVSGTMGELAPVSEIDGRVIENRSGTALLPALREGLHELIPSLGVPVV
ncbi:MAG: aminotransferase class IV [Lewinella sp.]|nr:aminotransferase class IV [Lewinella sp.]